MNRDPGSRLEERVREELAPYLRVVRLIGQSSAASVFLAREPALRRLVVVKVLAPELAADRKARLRFEREAQAAARIAHPNVVTVYRVGALSDDLPYLVMQYVRGRNLAQRLAAEGVLEEEEVRRLLMDLASGLAAAHRKRIVHRDVKPANVLYEEATGRVILTDFGIAAVLASGDEDPSHLTTRGHVLGDPWYSSPELLRGEELTELADMYSLGVVGFELLVGEGPYRAKTRAQIIAAHLREEPRRLEEELPGVDATLAVLIRRCLEKIPSRRPSAADFGRRLLVGVGSEATPTATVAPGPEAAAPHVPQDRLSAAHSPPGSRSDTMPGAAPEVTAEAPSGVFRLHSLGSLDLRGPDDRRLLSVLAQPKRVAILLYLAVGSHRGFKRRDTLLAVFWPELEQERARHALRQAIYVLRRALGVDLVTSRGSEEVGLDETRFWCDAVAFEAAVDGGRASEALQWYAGELLPGFFLSDAPEFERWLDAERQRLRRLASDAAWSLAEQQRMAGNATGAAHWARRAVEFSPWDESSLCRMIELLDQLGDRAGAIDAFDRFARQLKAEHQAEPAPETRALIRRVRDR
ncbi:MAG: protein kinase [Gemmatimonadota bacterium]